MTQSMSAAEILKILNEQGEEAGSDYNDAEAVDGWFGWTVTGDVLEVTHTPGGEVGDPGAVQVHRWRLVPA